MRSPPDGGVDRVSDDEGSRAEIRGHCGRDTDLILSEGYKNDRHPKIEVFRKGVHESLLCADDDTLFAVAADSDVPAPVPVLPLDDARPMADLITEQILGR